MDTSLGVKTLPQIIGGWIIKAILFITIAQFILWAVIVVDASSELNSMMEVLVSEVSSENCVNIDSGVYGEIVGEMLQKNDEALFIRYDIEGLGLDSYFETVEVESIHPSSGELYSEDKIRPTAAGQSWLKSSSSEAARSNIGANAFAVTSHSGDWSTAFGGEVTYEYERVVSRAADGTPINTTDVKMSGGRLYVDKASGAYRIQDLYDPDNAAVGCYSYTTAPQKYTPIKIDLYLDVYLPMPIYFGKTVGPDADEDLYIDGHHFNGQSTTTMEGATLPNNNTPALKIRLYRTSVVLGNKYFKGLPIGRMS